MLFTASQGMMVIIKPHLSSSPNGGLRARHLPHLMCTLAAMLFFGGAACAQERPALNEFTTWFGGQFANEHAFSETDNGRLYQVENRYTCELKQCLVQKFGDWQMAEITLSHLLRLANEHGCSISREQAVALLNNE